MRRTLALSWLVALLLASYVAHVPDITGLDLIHTVSDAAPPLEFEIQRVTDPHEASSDHGLGSHVVHPRVRTAHGGLSLVAISSALDAWRGATHTLLAPWAQPSSDAPPSPGPRRRALLQVYRI